MYACPPKYLSFAAVALATILAAPSYAQSSAPPGDRVRTVVDSLPGAVGGVAVDRLGLIYVADFGEQVFKITPDGRVSVFATGLYGASGNTVDSRGNLLQSSFNGNYVSRIDRHGNAEIVAEGLGGPVGIAVDPQDVMYVCNCRANTISRITPKGRVTAFAQSDLFNCPNGITMGPDSTLYVVNFRDARVLRVTMRGQVSELATLPGGGNGHITSARGDLYATSFRGHRIFRVSLQGDVTLVAGTGARGEDDGAAREATFSWPNGIAAGPQGDRLFVNDYVNRFPPTLEAPPAPRSSLRQITFASLSQVLSNALVAGGVPAMASAYRKWKSDPGTSGLFTEVEVNVLGYQLMGRDEVDAAVRLFELNAESYPKSWNAYDSLAEAYMNAGRTEDAIRSYEKSLELNPANDNAAAMLEKLRGS